MPLWNWESGLLQGLLFAGLVLAVGEARAQRWLRPVIWGLIGILLSVLVVLIGLVIRAAQVK